MMILSAREINYRNIECKVSECSLSASSRLLLVRGGKNRIGHVNVRVCMFIFMLGICIFQSLSIKLASLHEHGALAHPFRVSAVLPFACFAQLFIVTPFCLVFIAFFLSFSFSSPFFSSSSSSKHSVERIHGGGGFVADIRNPTRMSQDGMA